MRPRLAAWAQLLADAWARARKAAQDRPGRPQPPVWRPLVTIERTLPPWPSQPVLRRPRVAPYVTAASSRLAAFYDQADAPARAALAAAGWAS